MKKALSQIVIHNSPDEGTVFMTIVEKQSDTGITKNKRLFVLVEGNYFGYISSIKESVQPSQIDLDRMKQKIPLKNLKKVQNQKKQLKVSFNKQENNKRIMKQWVLTMPTEQLAEKWKQLLALQKSRSLMKKKESSAGSRGYHSPSKSQLLKINSDIKDHRINKTSYKKIEYDNPLYENNKRQGDQEGIARKLDYQNNYIIPQDSKQDKASDPNERNDPKFIMGFDNLKQLERKKQLERQEQLQRQKQRQAQRQRQLERQRQKRQQQREKQQIRKEKQELEKQRQRLQIISQMLKEQELEIASKKKAKEASSSVENSANKPRNKQITVLNQKYFKIDDSEHKRSSPPPKHSKVQLDSKPKQKVDNFNYYEIVNKLIINNEVERERDDRAQLFNEAHEYIFELEKQRMERQRMAQEAYQQKVLFSSQNVHKQKTSIHLGWTYRYLIKQAQNKEYEVVCEFGQHCEQILKQLVDQFHFPEHKKEYTPRYKCEEYYLYEKQDIEFKIAILGLKEVYNKEGRNERDKICDSKNVKLLENQYKNYQILYEASAKTGVVKVPLTCLIEFRGFIGFFKVNSYFQQKPTNKMKFDQKLENHLERISEKTKISMQTFQTNGNMLILRLDQKVYSQLAVAYKSNISSFDYYFIQDIKYLMPPDVLYDKKYKNEANERVAVLRKQILMQYLESNEKIPTNLYLSLEKKFQGKIDPSLRESRMKLEQVSQNILIPLTQAIREIDELNFYFTESKQLSEYLHSMGVNLRYLGLIYEHSNLLYTHKCILSQIAARVCKILLRNTLQDTYFEEKHKQHGISKQQYNQSIFYKLMDFFNCILGNSAETIAIWNVLSMHSLNYYNVKLQYDMVDKGLFLIALSHHCGLLLNWNQLDVSSVFEHPEILNENNFIGSVPRIKKYPPIFTQKEQEVLEMVKDENQQYFNELVKVFDLSNEPMPIKIKQSHYYHYVRKYLASFIPPNSTNSFRNLRLYQYSGIPSKSEIEINLMEMKWYLRQKKKDKYLNTFNRIITIINSFFGDYHPLLSDVYDVFSLFYQNSGEVEDAITFSKSSVINILKICGANHFKTAQSYYNLAQSCIKGGKKQQAVLNLQKAKKIFECCDKVDSTNYAMVTLKLGLLFLSENKISQAQEIVNYSLNIFLKNEKLSKNKFENERAEAYEILFRCYQLQDLNAEIEKLGNICQNDLRQIQQRQNLQKLLKIAIYSKIKLHKPELCSHYVDLINQIEIEPSTEKYIKSYERLQQRNKEESLFENFDSYIENIVNIQKHIVQNGTLKKWMSFNTVYQRETVNDFICLTQELVYFLGEGFLTGALRQNL